MQPDDERGQHLFSGPRGSAERDSVLNAPSGHLSYSPLSLKTTNYVGITSYFLPLMAAYLNILDSYDLRSFQATGRDDLSQQKEHQ